MITRSTSRIVLAGSFAFLTVYGNELILLALPAASYIGKFDLVIPSIYVDEASHLWLFFLSSRHITLTVDLFATLTVDLFATLTVELFAATCHRRGVFLSLVGFFNLFLGNELP
jgi:hypothetical protein